MTTGRQVEAIHECGKSVLEQRGFLRPGDAFLSAEWSNFCAQGRGVRYPQLWRNLWMIPVWCAYPVRIAVGEDLTERG